MFVQQRTWHHAKLLLLGALLTPDQRTVCSILRIVGLRRERHFVNYHRVLNRAVWHTTRCGFPASASPVEREWSVEDAEPQR